MQDEVTVSQAARDSRVARYLSDQKAARENLATYPEKIRQRLEAWQTEQREWFSDTILEIVAEFITIDDAIRHQAERETLARMEPVAWMYEYRGGVVAVTATRYDRGTIKALGYVETPLYALPPAPEAGQ